MSDTTTSTEVAPPEYYPHDTWAEDGDYAVPVDTRPFYAAANVTKQEKEGYYDGGAQVSIDIVHEVPRVVSPGRSDGEAVLSYEKTTEPILKDLRGPSGFPLWLHTMRLSKAQQAQKADDMRQAREAWWSYCQVCDTRDASVRAERVTHAGTWVTVQGCTRCRPVLVEAARSALAQQAAEQTLEDGRRVGDVAVEVVTALLEDGAA